MTGTPLNKKSKIDKFIADVVNVAVNAINYDNSEVGTSGSDTGKSGNLSDADSAARPMSAPYTTINLTSSTYPNSTGLVGATPLVDRSQFAINPSSFDYNSTGQSSAVSSAGGMTSAAALVDLFMIYAYNLSSIRRATITHTYIRNDHINSSGIAWNLNERASLVTSTVTALSAQYRMPLASFRDKVRNSPNPDPLANLQGGSVVNGTDLDNFIARLAAVLDDFRTSGPSVDIDLTSYTSRCHSSCHSSCHGSRGRR